MALDLQGAISSERGELPPLILQSISVRWTKAARGGPFAAIRNSIADAFVLPLDRIRAGTDWASSCVWHELEFEERNGLIAPLVERIGVAARSLPWQPLGENIQLDWAGEVGALRVGLTWRTGVPERWPISAACLLAPGEWGRIQYNYRTTVGFDSGWSYVLRRFNIGVGDPPEADWFVARPPTRRFVDLARLR